MDKWSMDNGYFSGPNLHAVDKHGIDGYIATDREEKPAATDFENTDRKFVKADFTYDIEADVFICPAGEKLVTNPASKAKRKGYRANKEVCRECPYRSRCSGSKKSAGRVIRTDKFETARQAMNKKNGNKPSEGSIRTSQSNSGTAVWSDRKLWIQEFQSARERESGSRVFTGMHSA
ncbi:transposase [Endozoicomonas euniceicola]|uniref:Transposase n=1 Tax=Endozoicomonas euniceicola TaxID=1234143 RepID=A0ABY6GVB1_9GAMM|nr:transposase [Endozoicomonas euniceicola]UYM16702.1 transposase [Endozoicomonas euniceicola]